MRTLLLVAPAADLAASLRFALEAEDFAVTETTSLAAARAIGGRFDCTVLDHHVLCGVSEADAADFMRDHWPLVLLANHPQQRLAQWSFRMLLKPLLGAALSRAVQEALVMADEGA